MKFLALVVMSCLSVSIFANELGKDEAIKRAEMFIGQNGYTNWPESKVKRNLDNESLETAEGYRARLKQRFNTLKPHAIGVRTGRKNARDGWSVAFDYVSSARGNEICRVVTMNADGSDIRIEHVEGMRAYFVGFDPDSKN